MPSPFGVSAASQKGLGGQDTTQILQRLFTGRVVGAPAFPYGGVSATPSTCVVTVDGFFTPGHAIPTFTANYEPRPQASNVPPHPPVGTPCFIVFAANGDHTPWATSFSGWPS
jgi:hypothetical protein